ncbi:hypothetical protein Kpol_499p1 [Vanderwaltozyma polyspora DSM 70294]|uniref:Uncharacterized protein n=1 Tax=Vanderwaltozyma polyspora (strain ATCC 22028 / DSM 70294 / BCRC 21397 / CBS 2163 / NBRC 10782 / NRRL Y-8283 / UCD 57-17) TaxID=436907 RepID=A7TP04_VANPO|nr:uncharacterized protein Kpol_499p1 [Vanderwaltozyma polyspora DSM 70294]EDO15973.1 hypothetical protein Kpol_499p1 [Vanderwaltozyma polyspora DSM 70294]
MVTSVDRPSNGRIRNFDKEDDEDDEDNNNNIVFPEDDYSWVINNSRVSSILLTDETIEIINAYSGESDNEIHIKPTTTVESPLPKSSSSGTSPDYKLKSLKFDRNKMPLQAFNNRRSKDSYGSTRSKDSNNSNKNDRNSAHQSQGTVSTSMLLDFNGDNTGLVRTNQSLSNNRSMSSVNSSSMVTARSTPPQRRTSSYYPPVDQSISYINNQTLPKLPTNFMDNSNFNSSGNLLEIKGVSGSSIEEIDEYEMGLEPELEDAVDALRKEMGLPKPEEAVPKTYYSNTSNAANFNRVGPNLGFYSDNYGLLNAEQNQTHVDDIQTQQYFGQPKVNTFEGTLKHTRPPPISNVPLKNNMLDGGWNATPEVDISKLPENVNESRRQKEYSHKEIEHEKLMELHEQFSDSQVEMMIKTIDEYKKASSGTNKGYFDKDKNPHSNTIPIQRLDSNSVYSFDSQGNGFRDIYSLERIALLFLCCTIVPILYFIIGFGPRGGLSE